MSIEANGLACPFCGSWGNSSFCRYLFGCCWLMAILAFNLCMLVSTFWVCDSLLSLVIKLPDKQLRRVVCYGECLLGMPLFDFEVYFCELMKSR